MKQRDATRYAVVFRAGHRWQKEIQVHSSVFPIISANI
jgi:hypothetical protein